MIPTDAAWLAGILDGEGTFMVIGGTRWGKPIYTAIIAVTNTNYGIVKRCKELAGGHIVGPRTSGTQLGKAWYRWVVKTRAVESVIHAVRPYLVAKGEQADLMLFLRANTRRGAQTGKKGVQPITDAEWALKRLVQLAMQGMNHRGTSPITPEVTSALISVRELLSNESKRVGV